MKRKVLVEGPFLTQSGYGEHARFVVRSLREYESEFEIYLLPLNWGQTSWIFEEDEERQYIDNVVNKTVLFINQNGKFDIHIHVGIPPEIKRKAPVCISVNAGIETTSVKPEWIDILNKECDKVITVSEHSKSTFIDALYRVKDPVGMEFDLKLNIPVEVVHFPVKKLTQKEINLELEYDFNFLCVAQWGPRKNIENTIKWFVEEFKKDKVGLVCKLSGTNNSIIDKNIIYNNILKILESSKDRLCKVYLLHGDLQDEEIHSLYTNPKIKAIVNFGHGEGFGLPLFEAAYSGLPVIAPDYSGHKDFLYMNVDGKIKSVFSKVSYEMNKIQPEAYWTCCTTPDMIWAFVKPLSAKNCMRELYKDYGRFKGQARKLAEYIKENFSEEKQNKKMVDNIREINEWGIEFL
jgi:glycosyltransferase involved in cell wall biosynthesis